MNYKHNKELVPVAKMLRKTMTKEERHLWYDFLRRYPVRFIRQKVIGDHVVDFYCAKAKLALEIDGGQHYLDENVLADAERTKKLNAFGIQVVRIPNNEVNTNFEGVCIYVDQIVKQSLSQ